MANYKYLDNGQIRPLLFCDEPGFMGTKRFARYCQNIKGMFTDYIFSRAETVFDADIVGITFEDCVKAAIAFEEIYHWKTSFINTLPEYGDVNDSKIVQTQHCFSNPESATGNEPEYKAYIDTSDLSEEELDKLDKFSASMGIIGTTTQSIITNQYHPQKTIFKGSKMMNALHSLISNNMQMDDKEFNPDPKELESLFMNSLANYLFLNDACFTDDDIDYVLKQICFKYIKRRALLDEAICDSNYVTKTIPEKQTDVEALFFDFMNMAILEFEELASSEVLFAQGLIKENADQLNTMSEIHRELCLEHEKTEQLQKEIESRDRIIEEMKKENHMLKSSLSNQESIRCNELSKQYHDEINELRDKLAKAEDEVTRLTEKTNQLTDDIEEMMSYDNVGDTETYSDITEEEIINKRIVFIRRNEAKSYPMMSVLRNTFPNSTFTNAIEKGVNYGSVDLVVLLTKYVEHGTYWSVRDKARACGTDVVHCDKVYVGGVIGCIAEYYRHKEKAGVENRAVGYKQGTY